jgi:protein-tyrosine phosphatase
VGSAPVGSAPVGWDGAVNAWRIAGSVYRMGRREWLTEQGWKQAHDDGVRTVIDLRNPQELKHRGTDPVVGEDVKALFDVVHAPTEEPDNEEFRALCGPYLKDPALYAHNARLFPHRLAAVFKALAAAEGGVVIHCSAGRDRSGLVAAMLQDLAGHSDNDIVLGYQSGMRGINERHRTIPAPHAADGYLDEDALAPLLKTRGQSTLTFIRQLNTGPFLLRNGVSEAELRSVLSALGIRVSL